MLQAMTEELERSSDNRGESKTQLSECPDCGVVGLPERIDAHDCRDCPNTRKEESTRVAGCISTQQCHSVDRFRQLIQTICAVDSVAHRLFKKRELTVNNCCTQLR